EDSGSLTNVPSYEDSGSLTNVPANRPVRQPRPILPPRPHSTPLPRRVAAATRATVRNVGIFIDGEPAVSILLLGSFFFLAFGITLPFLEHGSVIPILVDITAAIFFAFPAVIMHRSNNTTFKGISRVYACVCATMLLWVIIDLYIGKNN